MTNQSAGTIVNVEDPLVLRRFLNRLAQEVDTVVGTRGTAGGYVTSQFVVDAIAAALSDFAVDTKVYIGPKEGAPRNVTEPVLLILRDPGAPALQTSLVIREPD